MKREREKQDSSLQNQSRKSSYKIDKKIIRFQYKSITSTGWLKLSKALKIYMFSKIQLVKFCGKSDNLLFFFSNIWLIKRLIYKNSVACDPTEILKQARLSENNMHKHTWYYTLKRSNYDIRYSFISLCQPRYNLCTYVNLQNVHMEQYCTLIFPVTHFVCYHVLICWITYLK